MINNMEIVRHIGVIETNRSGWTRELNVIDWGSGDVYDIRSWAPGHEKCGKGITISKEALKDLRKLIDTALENEESEAANEQ